MKNPLSIVLLFLLGVPMPNSLDLSKTKKKKKEIKHAIRMIIFIGTCTHFKMHILAQIS